MVPLFLQARWILPVDAPPIDGGVVTIADGRITAVGPISSISDTPHDLGDVVLMPGLVNAHTHLEFSDLEKPLGQPGMPLPDWLRLALADRNRANRDVQLAINSGIEESVHHGVTTIGEIATVPWDTYTSSNSRLAITLFGEVIGFSKARAQSVLATVENRLEDFQKQRSDLKAQALQPQGLTLHPGISPHAPYTVHPQLLNRLIHLAIDRVLPIAMHLAESPEELQLLTHSNGPFQELLEERSMWDPTAIATGSRPLDYLQRLARAPRALVIHGNYLDDEEIEFLAGHRDTMAVAYCPRTHAYFGHTPYPLTEMLAAGVQVALGTDSRASNPDLSLLKEMREIARKHPAVPSADIVRMGTLQGAAALGQENVTGSITPGKKANLTAIPCGSACKDPYEAVVRGKEAPTATWIVGGKRHRPLPL